MIENHKNIKSMLNNLVYVKSYLSNNLDIVKNSVQTDHAGLTGLIAQNSQSTLALEHQLNMPKNQFLAI